MTNRMETHVKVLGVLYLALGALVLLAAAFLVVALGGAAGVIGATADPHDAAVSLPILGVVGTALVGFMALMSLPGIIVGIGLLRFRPWGRIGGLAVSGLNLINLPFGTAVGIYGLWVLLNPEAEALFGIPPSGSALATRG